MRAPERLDTEHASAARRELVRRGGAHGAEADDDDVVAHGSLRVRLALGVMP